MNALPLVRREAGELFARWRQNDITVAQFCGDVVVVSERLPEARYLINFCQDRYLFSVTFFAALLRGQTNLLPSRRDAAEAAYLKQRYERCAVVADTGDYNADLIIDLNPRSHISAYVPSCHEDHIAAIVFTSGSTGVPQSHAKSFGMLDTWRQVHKRYLDLACEHPTGLIATVPSWHMYGLEWAMLLPTIANTQLYCGPDFYPSDVNDAIDNFERPTLLVSTPLHLRALSKAAKPKSKVACVLSATAPLDTQLTTKVEDHFNCRIFEIFGCSEIGSLACRFPAAAETWSFFDCFQLLFNEGTLTVDHAKLPAPISLTDRFEQQGIQEYRLVGRAADIVKIGGKRESLAKLNGILNNIEGVEDGVIYDPTFYRQPDTGRLAALVVAPKLDSQSIRKALSEHIGTAFLPRPIRKVDALPRDTTSKLAHSELVKLFSQLSHLND